ncbi:REXO5 family protein [Megaselia abdita]
MKNLSSKQEARIEKKKKKITALARLVQLNESEETMVAKQIIDNSPRPTDDEEPDKKKRKTSDSEKQEEINFGNVKINLSEEEYTKLKKELNARKNASKNAPRLRLREYGERASLAVDHDNRIPIFFTDVQHLLMNALIGHGSPCTPERWCWLEKPLKLTHCVTVIVEGMSLYHFISNESIFKETNNIFETKLEVIMPNNCTLRELAFVPLTNAQKLKLIEEFGSLEVAVEMNKDPSLIINRIFNIEGSSVEKVLETENIALPPADGSVSIKDLVNKKAKVGRTKLLLSALQMVEDDYPLPLRGELAKKYKNFVFTKKNYKPVSDESPMFGVDCEMCRTSSGYNELTRISIVNEDHKTIYESLVRPTNKIVDYLTKYSGITAEMMMSVTKDLATVQKEVQSLLPPDAILIGQSLNVDLHAMKMFHPYCIDTSVIFNITGVRRRKTKLQTLSKTFLDEIIQENADGHDSVEDSLASLKLVQMKLVKGLYWGDVILSGKKKANELAAEKEKELLTNNFYAHVASTTKHTAIISTQSIDEKVDDLIKKSNENSKSDLINVHHVEDGHQKAVEKAQEVVLNNAFTLVNLPIDEENLIASNIENTCAKIDKYIGKLYTSVAKHGMFIVIFGGNSDSSSGSVKIKIKKRSGDERLTRTSTSDKE